MRHPLVKWILLCSLLVGLHSRLFAQDPCEVMTKLHPHGACQVEQDGCPLGDSDHDRQCPAEHHQHQGICGHATPYCAGEVAIIKVALPCVSRLWLRHLDDTAPDGPCLEEDIPPLI